MLIKRSKPIVYSILSLLSGITFILILFIIWSYVPAAGEYKPGELDLTPPPVIIIFILYFTLLIGTVFTILSHIKEERSKFFKYSGTALNTINIIIIVFFTVFTFMVEATR